MNVISITILDPLQNAGWKTKALVTVVCRLPFSSVSLKFDVISSAVDIHTQLAIMRQPRLHTYIMLQFAPVHNLAYRKGKCLTVLVACRPATSLERISVFHLLRYHAKQHH